MNLITKLHLFPIGIFVLNFVIRIPFLNQGYGLDSDAWLNIATAKRIALSGHYIASRFPGFPVVEWTYSLFQNPGYILANGISACMASFACVWIYEILKSLNSPKPFLSSIAIGCVSGFFIHSVTSMDYVWGIQFFMLGILLILKDRTLLAPISFAAAVGCRMTYLPLAITGVLLVAGPMVSKRKIGLIGLTLILSALIYLPNFLEYGLTFLRPETFESNVWHPVTHLNELLGPLGALALLMCFVGFFCKGSIYSKRKFRFGLFCTAAIVQSILFYLIMPHEAAYALPAVILIIVIAFSNNSRIFVVVPSIVFILSPFLFSFTHLNNFQILGPAFKYRSIRIDQTKAMESIGKFARGEDQSIIVTGYSEPMLRALLPLSKGDQVIRWLSPKDSIDHWRYKGLSIFYLDSNAKQHIEVSKLNKEIYGFPLDTIPGISCLRVSDGRLKIIPN